MRSTLTEVKAASGSNDVAIRIPSTRGPSKVVHPPRLVVHPEDLDPEARCWRCDARHDEALRTHHERPSTGVTKVAWWSGGMIEFALARRSANNATTQPAESRLPNWLRRFPAGHPVVMILGRQLPFGFHAVNVMAAISGVTIKRQMLPSAISNLIFAFIAAATGAGLVATGLI